MAKTIGSFDLASLKNLRDDVTQYFWFESDSSSAWGSGAHVTLYPESQFTNSTSPNYMKGQNIIMNTDGFSIRNGGLPMMVLDNNSLDFNVVDTSEGTYVTTATFANTGAQIGQTSGAHSVIDSDGQRFYGGSNGGTQLANIGYGEGAAQTGTAIAPYYTFGIRVSGSTIGNYSMAEGYYTTASGAYSHAEGYYTTASNPCSHAEGFQSTASSAYSHAEGEQSTASGYVAHAEGRETTASGYYSHAEGYETTTSGYASHAEGYGTTAYAGYSHAEGRETIASGTSSHAGGHYTIAQRKSQTVIGEYNVADTAGADGTVRGDYALIVGNGTADDARSNALTVDWNGNVWANGTIEASNSTPSISITTSTGTMVSSTIRRFGNVVQLLMTVQNSSSIAQGGNIYEGTITTTALRPIMTTTGGSYYSTSAIIGTISTTGNIVIRNEGGSKSFTSNCNISFTYIVA